MIRYDDPGFVPQAHDGRTFTERAQRAKVVTKITTTVRKLDEPKLPREPTPPTPYNQKVILYVRSKKYAPVVMHKRYVSVNTAVAAAKRMRAYGWQVTDPSGRVVAHGGK